MKIFFYLVWILFLIGCGGDGVGAIKKAKTIASINEASGICYIDKTKTLFVVGDDGFVYEIDTNGKELQKRDLNLTDSDFEGITYDKRLDLLYIAVEGVDNILVINRDLDEIKEVNIKRSDSKNQEILKSGGNGLEAISIYQDRLYLSNQSLVKLPNPDPSVIIVLDANLSSNKVSIKDIIDHGYIDISGMEFYNDTLYLVSDKENLLIRYDIANQKVIDTKDIGDLDDMLSSVSIEGVTFDEQGYIYFAIDDKIGGRVVKYKFF